MSHVRCTDESSLCITVIVVDAEKTSTVLIYPLKALQRMADDVPEMWPLDLLFSASGCRIFLPNSCIKMLNLLLLLIMVSNYAIVIYLNVSSISSSDRFAILSDVARYVDSVAGLIFILVINRHRHAFQALLSQAMEHLHRDQRQQLASHCRCSLAFVMLTIVLEFGFPLLICGMTCGVTRSTSFRTMSAPIRCSTLGSRVEPCSTSSVSRSSE